MNRVVSDPEFETDTFAIIRKVMEQRGIKPDDLPGTVRLMAELGLDFATRGKFCTFFDIRRKEGGV